MGNNRAHHAGKGGLFYGAILLSGLMFAVACNMKDSSIAQVVVLLTSGLVFVAGLLCALIQIGLGPRRFLRRTIAPVLAAALKPLNPTREELAECLGKFKAAGFRIGKKMRVEILWNALEAHHLSR